METETTTLPVSENAENREAARSPTPADSHDDNLPQPAKRRRDDYVPRADDSGLSYDEQDSERAAKRSRVDSRDRDGRRGDRHDRHDRDRSPPRRSRRDSSHDPGDRHRLSRDDDDDDDHYRRGDSYRRPSGDRFEGRRDYGKAEAERQERRKASVSQEERKRGKRLFGGLLSTLSQSTGRGPQLRRQQETERRQPDRTHRHTSEDDKRNAERMEKLARKRKIDQVKFDEQAMESRHANMLALAHNLQTKSRPRLYYRPYELTVKQERTIEDQIRAAEETIEKEKESFAKEKESRLVALGVRPTAAPVPASQLSQGHATHGAGEADVAMKDDRPEPEPEQATAGETSEADAIKVDSTQAPPESEQQGKQKGGEEGKEDDKSEKPQEQPPSEEGGKSGENGRNGLPKEQNRNDTGHRRDHDEHDRDRDVIMETEEDTVIY